MKASKKAQRKSCILWLALTVVLAAGMAVAEPADVGNGLSEADAKYREDLETYLRRLERLGFAGSVVVARHGVPIVAVGVGLADREEGTHWGPSTVSTVGSITKQFTGTAILALAEEGLLSPDDLISKYFDPVPEDKQAITLYHLLTHSSGIVDLNGLVNANAIQAGQTIEIPSGIIVIDDLPEPPSTTTG